MISTVAVCIAVAVTLEPDPASMTGFPDDSAVLSGPKVVVENRGALSIVEREFDGRLKKLEQHPVLVALDKMALDPDVRAKVNEVIQQRAAQLDGLVRDNLKTIIQLALANQSGDRAAAQKHLAELTRVARPYLDRGPLLNELRPVIPIDQYRMLKGAVEEYSDAATAAAKNDPADKPRGRLGALMARGVEGLQYDLKASYERVVQAGAGDFDRLLSELSLSPEQESRIRQQAIDLFQRTFGKPTKGQQLRLLLQIYGELSPEQRRILSRRIGQERSDERALRRRADRKPSSPQDMPRDDALPEMSSDP